MVRMKKAISIFLALGMTMSVMAGCGKAADNADKSTVQSSSASTASTASATEEAKKDEIISLKYVTTSDTAAMETSKNLLGLVEKRLKNIKLEPLIVAGEGTEWEKKVTISLMAGDEMDVLYQNGSQYQKYASAKLIEPLDEVIAADNYDVNKIFGSSISKYNDKIYMLPAFRDVHITMYNKTLFDKAGIPYPDNNTWTWNKYVEAAKAITKLGDGTYGSYMLDWDMYFMFSARQKKVPEYKADGTSNYDDPAFAESMKFFYDLGNVLKVQPDFITYRSKKMPWDAFFSTGKYGMFVVGNWATVTAINLETYPRDWKLGIAIMPQVNEGEKRSLSIMGGYSVSSTSKHKKEAFEAVKVLAEEQWTLPGHIPARIDLTNEQYDSVFAPLVEKFKNDGITVADLKSAILDPNMDLVDEKVIGPGMTSIMNAIVEEGELYASKQKSLEDTMKDLKNKADQAITEDESFK